MQFSQFHVSVDDLSHTVWASCENLEAEAGPQTDGPPESPYVSSEDEATEQRSRTGSSSQPDNLEVDDDDDDDDFEEVPPLSTIQVRPRVAFGDALV